MHFGEMETVRAAISRHALPCVLIGFGASSFQHKVAALLHALRLEHFIAGSLQHMISDFVASASDDGT